MRAAVTFKTGVYRLNPNPNFDYQLNRAYAWGGGDLAELREIGARIADADDWVREFLRLAQRAEAEGRSAQAAAYYRMTEFFMYDGDSRKRETYEKGISLFYAAHDELLRGGGVRKASVPYGTAWLPALVAEPEDAERRGAVLLHGGYDSYMEEFVPMLLYLRENGYAVYLFEGPGQGGALRREGLTFDSEWERPVAAVLDHFGLDDVTIIGLSLGAMLAPRAAAFEGRIKRVVAWSPLPDLLDVVLARMAEGDRALIRLLLERGDAEALNLVMERLMRENPMLDWALRHGQYNMGVASPAEFLKKVGRFRYLDVAPKITQDFLLLAAERDHFIPVGFSLPILDALTAARSLTYRLFTRKERAENHCNAGNAKLALDVILGWLQTLADRDAADLPD